MTSPKSWDLPLAGFVVTDIWFSGRISVVAYKTSGKSDFKAQRTMLSFGGPFIFQDRSGHVHELDAQGEWVPLTALFELRHQSIESAWADETSRIEVTFDFGQSLVAAPHPQYENWEVSGPDDLNLVGMPGGGDPRISGGLSAP